MLNPIKDQVCVSIFSAGHNLLHILLKSKHLSIKFELFLLKSVMVNSLFFALCLFFLPFFELSYLVDQEHVVISSLLRLKTDGIVCHRFASVSHVGACRNVGALVRVIFQGYIPKILITGHSTRL